MRVTELDPPWNGRKYRCEGFGSDPIHYSNAYGNTPEQAKANWSALQSKEKALIKIHNAEAKIYKHSRVW